MLLNFFLNVAIETNQGMSLDRTDHRLLEIEKKLEKIKASLGEKEYNKTSDDKIKHKLFEDLIVRENKFAIEFSVKQLTF